MPQLSNLPRLLFLTALLLLAAPARAAPPGAVLPAGDAPESATGPGEEAAPEDAREEVYRPTTSGPLVAYTAPITSPGRLTAQPLLRLVSIRGDFDDSGSYQELGRGESQHRAALLLFLEYGLSSRFAAGAELEWRHQQRREGSRKAASAGLGDAQLFARAVSGRYQGPPRLDGLDARDVSTTEVTLGAGVELIASKDVQLLVGYQRLQWGRNVSARDVWVLTLVPVLF